MLARLERELPRDGYLYEPKWDGFRGLAFRDGDVVDLRSRNQRPLARYFPELVSALRELPLECFALDGEIVVEGDFELLLRRLHPAASRVARLSVETPASYVAFDVIAHGARDVRELPFIERRRLLEELFAVAQPPLALTELTADEGRAATWLDARNGIDGRRREAPRAPLRAGRACDGEGEARANRGLRRCRLPLAARPAAASLAFARTYDGVGELQHVGLVSAIPESRRRELLERVAPQVVELADHPWEHGFLVAGASTGKLPGTAGRWTQEMDQDWVPLAPELVCEVAYDQVDRNRFGHPARLRRWRPDRDPRSCTLAQLA
jgi:ATP-dependent DNA ligase